jgi:adenylate cyclase
MSADSQYAIMFADVEGSTKLYKAVGDEQAKARVFKCISAMREVIVSNQGVVVKTIGDEIMARFDSGEDAINAAIGIHQRLELGDRESSGNLTVKVGVHFGTAIMDKGDIFGDAVNDAATMVKIAKGKQIVTTEQTANVLSPQLKSKLQPFDRLKLKAYEHEVQIHLVNWQMEDAVDDNATMIAFDTSDGVTMEEEKLYIQYQQQNIRVGANQGTFVFGRDPVTASLVVNSPFASRKHFWIEFRRGKWVLVDHSTNGTWVRSKNGSPIFVRREEAPLIGEGDIRLGENFDAETQHEIHFVAD